MCLPKEGVIKAWSGGGWTQLALFQRQGNLSSHKGQLRGIVVYISSTQKAIQSEQTRRAVFMAKLRAVLRRAENTQSKAALLASKRGWRNGRSTTKLAWLEETENSHSENTGLRILWRSLKELKGKSGYLNDVSGTVLYWAVCASTPSPVKMSSHYTCSFPLC